MRIPPGGRDLDDWRALVERLKAPDRLRQGRGRRQVRRAARRLSLREGIARPRGHPSRRRRRYPLGALGDARTRRPERARRRRRHRRAGRLRRARHRGQGRAARLRADDGHPVPGPLPRHAGDGRRGGARRVRQRRTELDRVRAGDAVPGDQPALGAAGRSRTRAARCASAATLPARAGHARPTRRTARTRSKSATATATSSTTPSRSSSRRSAWSRAARRRTARWSRSREIEGHPFMVGDAVPPGVPLAAAPAAPAVPRLRRPRAIARRDGERVPEALGRLQQARTDASDSC